MKKKLFSNFIIPGKYEEKKCKVMKNILSCRYPSFIFILDGFSGG